MMTSEMSAKLRRIGCNNRLQVLNHQDLRFLSSVADRLDELEERIAMMSEPQTASEMELEFPVTGKHAVKM